MRFFGITSTLLLACLSSAAFAAGLEPGDVVTGYSPKHLTGPDKGTKQCPPCKYSAGPMIQIWINSDSAENTAALAAKLESTLKANDKIHGVVIVIDETRKPEIEKWAVDWKLEKTALCYLSSSIRANTSKEYNLGTAKNVIVVSNAKKVLQSFENIDAADFEKTIEPLKSATK